MVSLKRVRFSYYSKEVFVFAEKQPNLGQSITELKYKSPISRFTLLTPLLLTFQACSHKEKKSNRYL